MTVVDFPLTTPVPMVAGRALVKSSVNERLASFGQPGLAGCSSLELLAAVVMDPNFDPFADLGVYLPAH
jgi:hypothetical protein